MKNPLSVEAFADWLATMPADDEYDWRYSLYCAIGQYLHATAPHIKPFACYYVTPDNDHKPYPAGFDRIAFTDGPHTFGAALHRAREYLEAQK